MWGWVIFAAIAIAAIALGVWAFSGDYSKDRDISRSKHFPRGRG